MGKLENSLNAKPLDTLLPDLSDSDVNDFEDDYEALRVIESRFAAYNEGGLKDSLESIFGQKLPVSGIINDSEKEFPNTIDERSDAPESFLGRVETSLPSQKSSVGGMLPSDLHDDVEGSSVKDHQFPKSALCFVDAIKKNRSCQKILRNKMLRVESRMDELKKIIQRTKVLKDFHVACKKRTGRALSQKRDARVQLISVPTSKANSKFNGEKIRALYKGPPNNECVAKYREAMATVYFSRDKWSANERENLVKGVKQQIQGILLQHSVDSVSDAGESCNPDNVDSVMGLIKGYDITSEKMRLFLPRVNWEQLAAMYVPRRSGAECQARFLNVEDPLVNHSSWTKEEDKNLLHIVQEMGLSNWMDIAASLGTNRTPFWCLVRYQRSLNASILKSEWTEEEDNQLRAAIKTYGESNWQAVASEMEGRTGSQCSNRWIKSIHPSRKRVGRWDSEEDNRLKVAVALFGPKWKEVAKHVPGRTHPQCRERWVNCLDPSLNMSEWTDEEDLKLEEAVAEHGHCWSKVASCIPRRTDNQCWRRWKVLYPSEVPLAQAARKVRKAALISNFVDRETERPALEASDFIMPEAYQIAGSMSAALSKHSNRKSRKHSDTDSPSSALNSEEVLRLMLEHDDDGAISQSDRDVNRSGTRKSTSSKRPRQAKVSSVELETAGDDTVALVEAREGEPSENMEMEKCNSANERQVLTFVRNVGVQSADVQSALEAVQNKRTQKAPRTREPTDLMAEFDEWLSRTS